MEPERALDVDVTRRRLVDLRGERVGQGREVLVELTRTHRAAGLKTEGNGVGTAFFLRRGEAGHQRAHSERRHRNQAPRSGGLAARREPR